MSDWREIAMAAYGNPYRDDPKVCVVTTRYGGCYEGGHFAALPVADVDSDAFGGDIEASTWWHENKGRVGVGATPDEALQDWFAKRAVILSERN